MNRNDLFHEGERAVQEKAGETHAALLNGRMIGTSILPQAIPFIGKQPWVILGGLDSVGQVWCSALRGEPGFAEATPGGEALRFDLRRAPLAPGDPLREMLVPGRSYGALFIELATRKRLRVNGRVAGITETHLQLAVEESFPNCPRFIQPRALKAAGSTDGGCSPSREGSLLGKEELGLLGLADTFFLSTLHPERGVDTSHRGGKAGFIERVGASRLRVPDYPGNSLFQTFGNLAVDDRCGWLVPDFATGGLLHLTGTAKVVWDDPDPLSRTAGTGRFLELQVARWRWTPAAKGGGRWTFREESSFNP